MRPVWSGGDSMPAAFSCFLRSYAEAGGELPADWETIYWSNYSRLEYNMKRSLGMECSKDEIAFRFVVCGA